MKWWRDHCHQNNTMLWNDEVGVRISLCRSKHHSVHHTKRVYNLVTSTEVWTFGPSHRQGACAAKNLRVHRLALLLSLPWWVGWEVESEHLVNFHFSCDLVSMLVWVGKEGGKLSDSSVQIAWHIYQECILPLFKELFPFYAFPSFLSPQISVFC